MESRQTQNSQKFFKILNIIN